VASSSTDLFGYLGVKIGRDLGTWSYLYKSIIYLVGVTDIDDVTFATSL
jgi:hypothetical protein